MPKWVLEIREELKELRHGASQTRLDFGRLLFDDVNQETGAVRRGLKTRIEDLETAQIDLSSRLGTSTPLIIWNIAVLIAIAYLYCKAYVPGMP